MDKNDEFKDNVGGHDDEFGLPDVEFQSLDQDHGGNDGNTSESDSKYEFPEEEEGSKTSLIVALVIGAILLLGGGALVYNYIIKPNAEKKKQEELAIQKRNEKIKKEARLAALEREKVENEKKMTADSIAKAEADAKSGARYAAGQGNIEVLSEATGRYHVVISSGIDDDLLTDYAKSLGKKGISTKIIAPYGKINFYRLTTTDNYDTYVKAQEEANKIGSDYASQAWVLKY